MKNIWKRVNECDVLLNERCKNDKKEQNDGNGKNTCIFKRKTM